MKARAKERYNHIGIKLQVHIDTAWVPIKAMDWNEEGFNFHLSQTIAKGSEVFFKNEQVQFSGTIVWVLEHEDAETIREMVLNNLIFKQVMKRTNNVNTLRRIFTMVRTLGILEEKQQLLDLFDAQIAENDLTALVDEYKITSEFYRYGVKTETPEWSKVVQQTLKTEPKVKVKDELVQELLEIIKESR